MNVDVCHNESVAKFVVNPCIFSIIYLYPFLHMTKPNNMEIFILAVSEIQRQNTVPSRFQIIKKNHQQALCLVKEKVRNCVQIKIKSSQKICDFFFWTPDQSLISQIHNLFLILEFAILHTYSSLDVLCSFWMLLNNQTMRTKSIMATSIKITI